MMSSTVEIESSAIDMPRARRVRPKASNDSTAAQKHACQNICNAEGAKVVESLRPIGNHPVWRVV